jgi:ribosomal RNA small subunit methyltransferase RsmB
MKTKTEEGTVNIRELVLSILSEVLDNNQYCSTVIRNTLNKYQYLEKQERAFLTRLSTGVIERQIELDYIVNQFSNVKVKKMKPVIRNILRMGVYQILYMEQVPDSAACNEAVKLAKKKGFHNLSGFVNGVLRNIGRNLDKVSYPDENGDPVTYLSVTFSIPEWILKNWLKEYNEDVVRCMAEASLADKNTTIRCNLSKVTLENLKQKLQEQDVVVENGTYLPYALNISGYNYMNRIAAFTEGYFQVQDESSMLVAQTAGIKKDDYIIDVCAAPGGKSLHAAELLQGSGKVVARDLTDYKVSLIRENIERLGYTNNIEAEVWDALTLRKEDIEKADIVFADLPCSGLGVIAKKPDIKYKVTPEQMEELAQLQRNILAVVHQYVKKDGILMYSTCTVNKKENLENVRWLEKEYGFKLDSLDPYLPEDLRERSTEEGYLQLIQGIHETDGFFIARLRRV